jgi:putative hydrolase of the HAD superfamily
MKSYQHIFFDLDRTLWDFDTNSKVVIINICERLGVNKKCKVDFETFYAVYQQINHELWEQYRNGKVSKEFLSVERFHASFQHFGLDDLSLATQFSHDYVTDSPYMTGLFPGTHELLQYLHKKYKLHLITNGFAEVQLIKLRESKLQDYFDQVIISEYTPWKKPSPEIFHYALEKANAKIEESIMIGDDLGADIKASAAIGMDQIWTNFEKEESAFKPTYEVFSLLEILAIL